MRVTRQIAVGGACVAIVAGGVAAAPQLEDGAVEADAAGADASANGDETVDSGSSAAPTAEAGDTDAGVTGTFDGPVVSNIRGDYQVSLTFEAGVLVGVDYPVAGTEAGESRRINQQALPVLTEEFLEEQSWDVEYVSGASYTSPAMVESAQAAFEDAGL